MKVASERLALRRWALSLAGSLVLGQGAFGSSDLSAPASVSSGASATKLVPIVLDLTAGNEHFTTELTLANRGTTAATVQLTYTPATFLGASGGGTAGLSLSPGQQFVVSDALAFLRSKGLPIPTPSASQGGTLLVSFTGLSSSNAAFVGARTTTPSAAGRAGLAYPGIDLSAAPTGPSYLYGLRSSPTDRSNLALVNAGSSPVTLRVTLFSGTAGDSRSYVLSPDTTLGPWQWTQIDHVLDLAGYTDGYARIDLVSGTGPYVAYAVFNDDTTNDGSYVAAESASMPLEMRLLPVLVESSSFQSELVLTNPLSVPQTATLSYVESYSPSGGAGGTITLDFQPGEQKIIESAIDFLRQNGVAVGPKGAATYAGALSVTFLNAGARSTGFAGARTAAPVGGTGPGEYGLFYPGTGPSFAALNEAWVYGLEQNAGNRSNLAVANLGDAGDSVTFRIDVYDGNTGLLAGSLTPPALPPGGWYQINSVLQKFSVASGYAHAVKLSGNSRFLAYGVVNDGGAPGQGTSDGSFVAAQAVAPITSFSVGPDITLTYPNLPVLSDEHTTVFPPAQGSDKYLIFAANMKNAGNLAGPVVLETTDLRTFTFASGYTSPVMTAAWPFTTCKPMYDPEFDLNYASPGSVVQDPTRPAGNLIMIYEAENHCPGAVWQHDFYATVGFARSSDYGKTWPTPVDAELGGTDRYPVLKHPTPEPATPESPQVALGNAIPSAFVDGTNLYVTYAAPGPTSDGMVRVARAPLGEGGTVAFSKWKDGAFGQPGIGGLDSGVLPARGCAGHQGMGQISHNDALGLYLFTFVCSGTSVGAWYYSTATSLDHQNWTAPQLIEGSQYPVVSGCASDGTGTSFDGWYPSFVSPGVPAGHTSASGSVLYMYGCDRGSRTFQARTFTIAAPSRPSATVGKPPAQ